MALYEFDEFLFDTVNYKLSHKHKALNLRPKVLELLKLLIENRHRVVSKAEILSSIWGDGFDRDHLLFQLVSELRRAPFNSSFIRTLPNKGYQWNVVTQARKPARFTRFSNAAIAASLALVISWIVVSGTIGASIFTPTEPVTDANSLQLPAFGAFSKGVVALNEYAYPEAEQWFKFALLENPQSQEAQLFLAEALLRQENFDESSEQLHELLSQQHVSSYNRMSANNMLGQILQTQGHLFGALNYAQKSKEAYPLAQCSSEYIDKRSQELQALISPSTSDHVLVTAKQAGDLADAADSSPDDANQYSDLCNQLKASELPTSQCELYQDSALLAGRRRVRILLIS